MQHDSVNIHSSSMSCGVMELSRLSTDDMHMLYAIASRLYHPSRGNPCAFIVYSDVEGAAGDKLSQTVVESGFGTVTKSDVTDNPHTGNAIAVYVWNIDHEAFKDWYSNERVKRLSVTGT